MTQHDILIRPAKSDGNATALAMEATAKTYRYLDDESDGSDGPLPGYGATAASEIGTGKDMRNPIQHQFVGGEGIATCLVSLSGLEYNWGRKETTHVGSIDTGEEVLSRLERSRNAQRISFGLFFNY